MDIKKIVFSRKGVTVDLLNGITTYYRFENDYTDSVNANDGTGVGTSFSSISPIVGSYLVKSFNTAVSIPSSTDFHLSSGSADNAFSFSFWWSATCSSSQ